MSPSSALRDAMPAEATLAERVRARLRADGIDPTRDPEAGERLARAEVRRHNDAALARGAATLDDEDASVRGVLATVAGYGPLQPLLDDPEVEEVWINAPDRKLLYSTCCSLRPARVRARSSLLQVVDEYSRVRAMLPSFREAMRADDGWGDLNAALGRMSVLPHATRVNAGLPCASGIPWLGRLTR